MLLRYLSICSILLSSVVAQPKRLSEAFEQDRARAYALVHEGKYKEAQQILASLAKKAPEDTGVLFNYGYALYLEAETITDSKANAVRKKARDYFLKAKQIGLNEPLVEQLLAFIREDGSKIPHKFSANLEAEVEMRNGEVAFSKRDFSSAQQHYTQALKFDPKLYGAAVFLGDIQFVQQQYDEAGLWFEKAVAIDQNQETAYRYWGDALSHSGRADEACDKYMQAIIAEPYNGLPWRALEDWARRKGLQPRHPATRIPHASLDIKDGKVQLGVDPADGTLGMAYGIVRAGAASKAIAEKRIYRHSLADEESGLQAILEIGTILIADPKQAEEQKVSAMQLQEVAQLKQLVDAGHLDAYIFFVRVDAALANDYSAYRAANRAKLTAYLREVFLGLKPSQSSPPAPASATPAKK